MVFGGVDEVCVWTSDGESFVSHSGGASCIGNHLIDSTSDRFGFLCWVGDAFGLGWDVWRGSVVVAIETAMGIGEISCLWNGGSIMPGIRDGVVPPGNVDAYGTAYEGDTV